MANPTRSKAGVAPATSQGEVGAARPAQYPQKPLEDDGNGVPRGMSVVARGQLRAAQNPAYGLSGTSMPPTKLERAGPGAFFGILGFLDSWVPAFLDRALTECRNPSMEESKNHQRPMILGFFDSWV